MLEPHKPHYQHKNRYKRSPDNIGSQKRVKEIPELKMAMISVLLASFEVNQIIDKNRNIGNKELAK
jgi:hypothetical protein